MVEYAVRKRASRHRYLGRIACPRVIALGMHLAMRVALPTLAAPGRGRPCCIQELKRAA